MKHFSVLHGFCVSCILAMLMCYGSSVCAATVRTSQVRVIPVQGVIGPAMADFVVKSMSAALKAPSVSLIILRIDTPGGLSVSMRRIIQNILAATKPVVGYVAPQGARAASAGTYLLYATHIAAMAPATHLGAATPVAMNMPDKSGATASNPAHKKAVEDAKSYIRSLAELRGRNAQWAMQAVTHAATLTAQQALKKHVINIIASSTAGLLQQLNLRQVKVKQRTVQLHTQSLAVVKIQPNWQYRFLMFISNPMAAYFLLMMGFYGVLFELIHPGYWAPGVLGGIAFLIGCYALQLMPVNIVGLGLIALGIICVIVEAFMPSFGVFGIGGLIAFIIGSVMLLRTATMWMAFPVGTVSTVAAVGLVLLLLLIRFAVRLRHRKSLSGAATLLGQVVKLGYDGVRYWVSVQGERWQVRDTGDLHAGMQGVIDGVDGSHLIVRPLQSKSTKD